VSLKTLVACKPQGKICRPARSTRVGLGQTVSLIALLAISPRSSLKITEGKYAGWF